MPVPSRISPRFIHRVDVGALIAVLVAGALTLVLPVVGLLAGVGKVCQAFQPWNRDDLDRLLPGLYVGSPALWLAFVGYRRVLYQRDERLTRGRSFVRGAVAAGMAALLLAFAGQPGLRALNALLDLGTKEPVRVVVEARWTDTHRDKHGHTRGTPLARVRRTSAPFDAAVLHWSGCPLDGQTPSPYVDIHLGKGAFGIPWVAYPVVCHPLAADEPRTP